MESGGRLLLHVRPSFAIGGAERRLAAVANALGPAFRHRLYAMDDDYAALALFDGALDVKPLDDAGAGNRLFPATVPAFRRVIARLRPDLLVTGNWGAIEWALANTPRLVPHLHIEDGFGPDEAERRFGRRALLRRLALTGKTVAVPSWTLCDIARREWGVPETRLRFIPNGVDVARFAAARPLRRQTFGAPANIPLIGTVAALRTEKNLPRLVDAFAEILAARPARLVIVGDGPARGAIEARASALGLSPHVCFAGRMADPAPALAAFDLFMMSSDTEQAPLSLLEAMAAGLAVVAPGIGDIGRMLSEENRPFLAPPGDASGLASGALALLADEPLRRRMGLANRARAAADYSFDAMTTRWRVLWSGAA